jgi:hypothetical protein
MTDYLRSLFQRADIGQSRSAITNQLQWAIVILLCGIVISWRAGIPLWVLTMEGLFLGILLLLFVCVYIYFAITNPDALRSEHYSLSKMAIERGLVGDSVSGLIDENDTKSTALVIDQRNVKDSGR